MKTSNKLLLALVALLYVLPLCAIVIDLKHYRPIGEMEKDITGAKFADSLSSYSATKFDKPFQTVEILNGAKMHFVVVVHPENTSGIKVGDNYADKMNLKVDATGKLTIEMRQRIDKRYAYIHLYGPQIAQIVVKGAGGLTVEGEQPVLAILVEDMDDLMLGNQLQARDLTVKATNVKKVEMMETRLTNANIDLTNSKLEMFALKISDLQLRVDGVELEVEERADVKEPTVIKSMNLVSSGYNRLNFDRVRFTNVAGNLSDSTTIHLPVKYLRTMIK